MFFLKKSFKNKNMESRKLMGEILEERLEKQRTTLEELAKSTNKEQRELISFALDHPDFISESIKVLQLPEISNGLGFCCDICGSNAYWCTCRDF